MSTFSISQIQPTMRDTVLWVRSLGFNTTDSGDGITNVEAGMEGAIGIAHVFMVIASDSTAFGEADRLWEAVCEKGLGERPDVDVQMGYSPKDEVTTLCLFGVYDQILHSNN